MKTDTIGRRKSNTSQSTGKRVDITEFDLALFRGLRRYHPLPTPLAFHFWNTNGHYNSFQDRMRNLNHEAFVRMGLERIEGPVVERPWELNPPPPNPEPAWYELTDAGRSLAPTTAPIIASRDPRHHRGANACVGASFELLAPHYGMEVYHEEEIYLHSGCPSETSKTKNPRQIDGYEPDALMGLRILDAGYRFFVREQDRGVTFSRRDPNQTSNQQKIDKLLSLFASKRYQKHWGIPNLRAMFITTSQGRIDTMLEYLKGKPYAERFLFKALPQFHRRTWKAPREPISELFEPWITVKGPFDITKG